MNLLLNTLMMLGLAATGIAHEVDILKYQESFIPLIFKDKPETAYQFKDSTLSFVVKKSASALILPFAEPCKLTRLSIIYQMQGQPKLAGSSAEAEKKGDDSFFRIGLMISGKAPLIPFFSPAWVKKLGTILKSPSDRMLYLWLEAQHRPGETWLSPYTGSIQNVGMTSVVKDGHREAVYAMTSPAMVVGLWLMADGDDTGSEFSGTIMHIKTDDSCRPWGGRP